VNKQVNKQAKKQKHKNDRKLRLKVVPQPILLIMFPLLMFRLSWQEHRRAMRS
jgi:hypothetical protein